MSEKQIAHNIIDNMDDEELHSFIVLFSGYNQKKPNEETLAAMEELENGKGKTFQSLADLWSDLESEE